VELRLFTGGCACVRSNGLVDVCLSASVASVSLQSTPCSNLTAVVVAAAAAAVDRDVAIAALTERIRLCLE